MTHHSRRRFLHRGALGLVASRFPPFASTLMAMSAASAASSGSASSGGYQAIVFLNLVGGNDGFNMVLPTDPDAWATYQRLRDTRAVDGNSSIALPASSLLPITPTSAQQGGANQGRSFALHPSLPKVQGLFSQKRLSVVAGVGTLLAPTTAAQCRAGTATLPPDLFSHNSQAATWQACAGDGSRLGWGGRLADMVAGRNTNALFTSITTSGNSLFLASASGAQLQVGPDGIRPIFGLVGPFGTASSVVDRYPRNATNKTVPALSEILTGPQSDPMLEAVADAYRRSILAQSMLDAHMTSASHLVGMPASNSVALQLGTVVQMMTSAAALGVRSQVFFVQATGYDTHDGQAGRQATLLKLLDDALGFYDVNLAAAGLSDRAILFTGSEFGRTTASNGDGTDHGWGNHHFVHGAVKGGDILGSLPPLGVNDDAHYGTALVPKVSVDQLGASLARWMGVSSSDLTAVFPNLPRFDPFTVTS